MAKEDLIKKEDKDVVSLVIESPWKKIIAAGLIILALVVLVQFSGNYLSNLTNNLSLMNIIIPIIIALAIAVVLIVVIKIIKGRKEIHGGNEEVKEALSIADRLLSKLSDDEIRKFSKTSDAKLYEKILKKYNIK